MDTQLTLPLPDEIDRRIRDCREELIALKKLRKWLRLPSKPKTPASDERAPPERGPNMLPIDSTPTTAPILAPLQIPLADMPGTLGRVLAGLPGSTWFGPRQLRA